MSRLRLTRLLPHYRRLMRDGTPTDAVVLRSEPIRLTSSAARTVYRLTLEVHYPDGRKTEIVRTVTPFEVGITRDVGDILPVRYNPEDRSDVDVDVPTIKARQLQADREAGERRVERARQSLDGKPEPEPDRYELDDDERSTAAWLEHLVRLKLGHQDGAVPDARYTTETSTARAGLKAGTAFPLTGDHTAETTALAHAILGDPIPGTAAEVEQARSNAALLERIVRLKLRHESGALDDHHFRAEQAKLAAEARDAD